MTATAPAHTAPSLLNDDGTASIATALLMSHHGLRRDLARFGRALARLAAGEDASRAAAVAEEWTRYRNTLHAHHEAEDTGLFPGLLAQRAELASIIERLTADHRRIDPLLEAGDRAFGGGALETKAGAAAAAGVVAELGTLLDAHLAVEEASVVQFLRAAKQFPPPPNDEAAELFAHGFAWSSDGVAADVLARVDEMLPPILVSRLPAARAAFEERRRSVWGGSAEGQGSRTAMPDWLASASK